jgi:hypothetical protein
MIPGIGHNQPPTPRAVVRVTGNYLVVLCPIGHLIFATKLDRNFAGSKTECDWGAHCHPHDPASHPWDRQAALCDGAGH